MDGSNLVITTDEERDAMSTILYNMRIKEANVSSSSKLQNTNGTFFYNNERYLDEMQRKYRRYHETPHDFIIDEDEKEFTEGNAPKQRSFSCRQYPSSSRALSSIYTNSGITTIGETMEQNSNYTNESSDGQSSSSSASSFSKSSGSSVSAVVANVANAKHVHVLTDTASFTSTTVDSGRESIVESPNSIMIHNNAKHLNGSSEKKYVNFSQVNHQGTVNVQLANKQSLDTRC